MKKIKIILITVLITFILSVAFSTRAALLLPSFGSPFRPSESPVSPVIQPVKTNIIVNTKKTSIEIRFEAIELRLNKLESECNVK